MNKLVSLILDPPEEDWKEQHQEAFEELFGSDTGRYPQRVLSQDEITLRAPYGNIPFAAYIHPSNPDSGPYGGMSFVIFPPDDRTGSCLISMVVGTQGLNPDEQILSRPGHARKIHAICEWLNKKYSSDGLRAWSKNDPVRIEQSIPDNIQQQFDRFHSSLNKYDDVVYGMFDPKGNPEAVSDAVKAFLDIYIQERGYSVLSAAEAEATAIQEAWMKNIFPDFSKKDVQNLLKEQKFLILQGPPGTGKTRLALELFKEDYQERGLTVQFHPNIAYEDFVGGLFPKRSTGELGFEFHPKAGWLLKAIQVANQNPDESVLLVIDEINRADLSSVLGEAVFLFESEAENKREITLPYQFDELDGDHVSLPGNLHVLGTMNTADQSIASFDVAIRRRFSFLSFWPQLEIVEEKSCDLMVQAFRELLQIFIEYAPDDQLNLLPGHSYFLQEDQKGAIRDLRVNVKPLLEDYLQQGYITGFQEPLRAYLQWIESLNPDTE